MNKNRFYFVAMIMALLTALSWSPGSSAKEPMRPYEEAWASRHCYRCGEDVYIHPPSPCLEHLEVSPQMSCPTGYEEDPLYNCACVRTGAYKSCWGGGCCCDHDSCCGFYGRHAVLAVCPDDACPPGYGEDPLPGQCLCYKEQCVADGGVRTSDDAEVPRDITVRYDPHGPSLFEKTCYACNDAPAERAEEAREAPATAGAERDTSDASTSEASVPAPADEQREEASANSDEQVPHDAVPLDEATTEPATSEDSGEDTATLGAGLF